MNEWWKAAPVAKDDNWWEVAPVANDDYDYEAVERATAEKYAGVPVQDLGAAPVNLDNVLGSVAMSQRRAEDAAALAATPLGQAMASVFTQPATATQRLADNGIIAAPVLPRPLSRMEQANLGVMAPEAGPTTFGQDVDDLALAVREGARNVSSATVGLPVNWLNAVNQTANVAADSLAGVFGQDARNIPMMEQPGFVRGIQEGLRDTNQRDAEEYSSDLLLQQRAQLAGAEGVGGTMAFLARNPSALLDVGAQQVGQALNVIPGAGKTANIAAGALSAGGMNADQVAAELRQRFPGMDEQEIQRHAAEVFAASTLTNAILPNLGEGASVIERGIGGQIASGRGGLGRQMVEGLVGEGWTGAASEASDQLWQNIAMGDPATQGLGQAAVLGALLEGPLGGLAGAGNALGDRPQAAPTQNNPTPEPTPGELLRNEIPLAGQQDFTAQNGAAEAASAPPIPSPQDIAPEPTADLDELLRNLTPEAVDAALQAIGAEPESAGQAFTAAAQDPDAQWKRPNPTAPEGVQVPAPQSAPAGAGTDLSSKPTAGDKVSASPVAAQPTIPRAVPAKARKPATKTDKAGKPMDLVRVIAANGGLSRAAWQAQGVDPTDFRTQYGINWLFRAKGGMTPSDLREFMQQEGYLATDRDDRPAEVEDNDAIDLFDRAFRGGEEIFAPDQQERVAAWREARQAEEDAFRAEREPDEFDAWLAATPAQAEADEAADLYDLLARAYDLGATDADVNDALFGGTSSAQQLIDRLENDNGDSAGSEAGDSASGESRERRNAPPDEGVGSAAAQQTRRPAGLFPEPTAREEVEAERRRRDEQRDGRNGTGRTDMAAGAGELFAGPRPQQADIEGEPRERLSAAELTDTDLTPEERAAFDRFRTQADDRAADDELQTQLGEASRREGERDAERRGLKAAVRAVLGDVAIEWVKDYDGLPDDMRRGVEARNSSGRRGRTTGLYSPKTGTVYLVTERLATPEAAAFTAAHEIAGHHGLRRLLGNDLNKALDIAEQNPTVKKLADAIAEQRKLRGDQRRLATEEALAELAAAVRTGDYARIASQYGVQVPTGIRAGVKAAIENFLRRLKALFDRKGAGFTDAQVRELLEAAWQAARGQDVTATALPEALESVAPDQTETPAFKRWFGDSKVVDADGKPLVVYHGTTGDIRQFDRSRLGENTGAESAKAGFFFTDDTITAESYANYAATDARVAALLAEADKAERKGDWDAYDAKVVEAEQLEASFADPGNRLGGQNVVPVYLAIQNPLVVDAQGENAVGFDIPAAIKRAMKEGFDGIIIRNFDDAAGLVNRNATHYVVFHPEQIKSATANRGTFDPDKPSILESVTPQEAERQAEGRRNDAANTLPVSRGTAGWNYDESAWEGVKGNARRARARLQDKMIAWRDAQQQIAEQVGQAIPDTQDVYRMENLMHGRAAEGIRRIEDAQVKPLVEAMRAAKVDTKTFEEYLYARHAKERNAQIAKINPALPDGGSGMTDTQATAILAAADKAKLEPLARRIDAITKATRRRMLEHGLITQEAFDAMEAQYQHFVPLRGQQTADTDFAETGGGAGRGLDTRRAPVKQAMGRRSRAQNILAEVIGDAQRSVILAEKARVGRAVMRLVLANPNPDLWQVEPVQTERAINAEGEVYERLVQDWSDPSIVAVRHKGKLWKVQINSAPLAQALNHVGIDQLGTLTRAAGMLNRWFSAVLTKYNPAFTPVNATRDALFGLTGLAAEHGDAAALDAALHYPLAASAAYRQARGKSGDGQWDRWATEFAEHGGKTGYVNMPSVEDFARRVGKGGLSSYSPTGAAAAARWIADAVGNANDAVENALRLSAYVTMRKRGQSADQAAAYAKDLTVNFNRKGFDGSKINAWFLFYNASLQGAKRTGDILRKPKTWGFLGTLAAIQSVATLAAMGMRDDEEDDSLWDKIPDHVKRRNLVIPVDGETFVTVPMPYGFNLFTYLSGRITSAATDPENKPADKAASLAADTISAAVESFAPVPLDDGALGLLPTAIRIPANIQTNRDDFGHKIRREDAYAKSAVPRASMGRPDTLELFKLTSKGLNRLGGGDDFTPPPMAWMDVAPEDLEYLVKAVTGGAGKFVVDVATLGQKATGGELTEGLALRDIPITKRFVTNVDQQASEAALYYNRRESIDRGLKRVRGAYRTQGAEAAETLLKSLPELKGAAFKRRKKDSEKGPAGSIIEVNGSPQIVAVDEDVNRGEWRPVSNPKPISVFAAYKAAEEANGMRGDAIEDAYADAPAALWPTKATRERDARIKTEDRVRTAALDQFNRVWVRDVVGTAE